MTSSVARAAGRRTACFSPFCFRSSRSIFSAVRREPDILGFRRSTMKIKLCSLLGPAFIWSVKVKKKGL